MIHMCFRIPKLWYSLNDKENKQKCELIVRILYVKKKIKVPNIYEKLYKIEIL